MIWMIAKLMAQGQGANHRVMPKMPATDSSRIRNRSR